MTRILAALDDLVASLPGAQLVVPRGHRPSHPPRRMVAALDGTPEAAAALEPVIAGALASGLDVVVVHVLHASAAPAFVDQPHHWTEAFRQEFGVRNAPQVAAPVELRAGDPPGRLLDAAKELDADVLALAWSQVLAPGRAAVVRAAMDAGELPILLVPTSG